MRTLALVLLLIVAGPPKSGHYVLRGQDFSTVKLTGLPTVYVEERSGTETKGKLISLTESALVVNIDGVTRTYTPAEIVRIDRRGDSLKNGALIGAVVGLFTGLIGDCPGAGSNNESNGCPGARVGYFLGGAAIWGAIGVGIDALIPGRTLLWKAPPK